MLEKILSQVEKVFPSSTKEIPQETWDKNITSFCEQILLLGDDLFKILEDNLSKNLSSESMNEVVTTKKPMITICETRLRPKSSYYKKLGKPVPSPENPTGPHATGIELSLSLHKGYPSGKAIPCPWFSIDFSIWGCSERTAFLELLKDHRRFVEKLLHKKNFEFGTACWFDNIEKYKGNDVFKKLDLYSQNDDDQESSFTISGIFTENSSIREIISSLISLGILYDTSLGYCVNKKDKDRIFQYIRFIS